MGRLTLHSSEILQTLLYIIQAYDCQLKGILAPVILPLVPQIHQRVHPID